MHLGLRAQGLTAFASRDHPLVIYAFTEDKTVQDKIRRSTMSGGLVFNDTFQQLSGMVLLPSFDGYPEAYEKPHRSE